MSKKISEWYNANYKRFIVPKDRHKRIIEYFYKLGSGVMKGKTVLDLGCGAGITSKIFADMGAREVVAIDFSDILIEHARTANSHPVISYHVGDATNWAPTKKFDWIMLIDLIEHVNTEKQRDLIRVADSAAGFHSCIFMNVPYLFLTNLLRKEAPDKLQIIDDPPSIRDLLLWFQEAGWVPVQAELFENTYWELLFMRHQKLNQLISELHIKKKSA